MLPKAEGAASVNDLAGRLAARGAHDARILPIASETARAVFQLGSYSAAPDRLAGLTRGAQDRPAPMGAAPSRKADDSSTHHYKPTRPRVGFGWSSGREGRGGGREVTLCGLV